jgi:hypothetical protein
MFLGQPVGKSVSIDEQVKIPVVQQLGGKEVGILALATAAVDHDGILRAGTPGDLEGEEPVL